jgi:enterochelin esterase family protein
MRRLLAARPSALTPVRLGVAAGPVVRLALIATFFATGFLGLVRYLDNFWVYRGYPPPREPLSVPRGMIERISVASPALGGQLQPVLVYFPPGYGAYPAQRFPVFYLLHGFPGRADSFLTTVQMGVREDVLVSTGRARPVILVMPASGGSLFSPDTAWADGVRPHSAWATFVARDLVASIDARFRTIADGPGRAIGGLSEGGYAALNIALHHPGEFRVVESWSGYELADRLQSVFGHDPRKRSRNSPLALIGPVAAALRRTSTFIWFYTGAKDSLRAQNDQFAAALRRLRIQHRYLVVSGRHDWRLWRGYADAALLAAATRLSTH